MSSIAYNQATTKLAFHSNETSKDKLSIIYNLPSIIVGIAYIRQFQCVPQTYVTEIKET